MSSRTGDSRDAFLESIRHALGRGRSAPETPYATRQDTVADLQARSQEIRQRVQERQTELLGKFAAIATQRGWRVFRTSDPEDAIRYVGSVAVNLGVNAVVRSDQEVFLHVPVDAALGNLGIRVTTVAHDSQNSRETLRREIAQSGLGLTGADYAVAETGSVVVLPRRGLSRLVSVYPPVHIALVQPPDLVESLDDVFTLRRLEYYEQGGDMGSYLNFITGPSRTADIEQTIVVGVHGPREVYMVLLG